MPSHRFLGTLSCEFAFLLTGFFVSPDSACGVVFSDGEFLNSTWDYTFLVFDDPQVAGSGPGTSTGSNFRADNAGDPGAYRASTHNISYGDTLYSVGINTSELYIPIADGPIQKIDFSIDLQHPGAGATAWQMVVQQNGTFYYSYPLGGFPQNPFWNSFGKFSLTQADFDTNPLAGALDQLPDGNAPNFSATGNPLRFGYALGNTNASGGTEPIVTTTHGADNWRVSINPGILGDFDFDGDVDGHDFLVWQRDTSVGNLSDWQANYGLPLLPVTITVPEPTGLGLIGLSLASFFAWSRGRW